MSHFFARSLFASTVFFLLASGTSHAQSVAITKTEAGGQQTTTFSSGQAVIVSGTAPAGANVIVYFDISSSQFKIFTADANGDWSGQVSATTVMKQTKCNIVADLQGTTKSASEAVTINAAP